MIGLFFPLLFSLRLGNFFASPVDSLYLFSQSMPVVLYNVHKSYFEHFLSPFSPLDKFLCAAGSLFVYA